MNECCGTCNYFCEVWKHPTYQEVLTHICILPAEEKEYYILETTENDTCERYMMRCKN